MKLYKLTVSIDSIGSSTACCDAVRIGQVITNLLSNAIKFSPLQSNINVEIKAAPITLPSHQIVTGLLIKVTDHGVGIPEDELEAVFDKFIQSSKTNAGGTGLGLSICNEIIKAHQGKIWAENGVDGGAIFYFLIPEKRIQM